MNIGRLEEGRLILPTEAQQKRVTVTNPSAEILKCVLGMKDVVYGDKPAYDPVTQYLREIPTDEGNRIAVAYAVEELTGEEVSGLDMGNLRSVDIDSDGGDCGGESDL